MTQHTADEFAASRFATHPNGRIAARIDTDGHPWVTAATRYLGGDWRTDEDMAADGWSPLDESPPSVVSEFTITGNAARDPEAVARAVRKMLDEGDAAPPTDEDRLG